MIKMRRIRLDREAKDTLITILGISTMILAIALIITTCIGSLDLLIHSNDEKYQCFEWVRYLTKFTWGFTIGVCILYICSWFYKHIEEVKD